MRMRNRVATAACVMIGNVLPVALAHEYWLEPETYRPKCNSVVRVRMALGERFAGGPSVYDPDHVAKFELVGPEGESAVRGRSGGLTSFARVSGEGTYVLGYHTKRTFHKMDAAPFEAYLIEEGLAPIVAERKKLGESEMTGREAYSRCAKSILTVGQADDGFQRRLGYPLEIMAEQNPATARAGQAFAIRLLHEGKPLADSTVVAVSRDRPSRLLKAQTNADGVASFTLPEAGVWMVTAIHMLRVTDGAAADWESFWASLTFEVPGESDAQPSAAVGTKS